MFHMEHCVFCAFLSKGKDYRDCGRPCDKHRVKLRDRVGAEHILKADAGCRNTLYNSRAQTGAEYATELLALGVRRFRIEFVDEDAATVTRTLERYQALLDGKITGTELWNDLRSSTNSASPVERCACASNQASSFRRGRSPVIRRESDAFRTAIA